MKITPASALKSFYLLHFKTKILEACQWDEKVADNIVALLDYELSIMKRVYIKTPETVLFEVYDALLKDKVEKRIIDAVIEVLRESLESAPFLLDSRAHTPGAYH